MAIDKSSFPTIRTDVSITHHPDTVACKWVALDEDGTSGQTALNAAIAASKAVYVAQAELLDTRKSLAQHLDGKPVMTPKGLKLRHGMEGEYAAAVQRVRDRVLKSFDSYHHQLAGICDGLQAKLTNMMKDKTTPPAIQAEIRAHVRSLPEKSRFSFVMGQDLATYAAVATAPAFLSGFTQGDLGILDEQARAKHAPVENAQNAAVNEVFGHLAAVRAAFIKWADAEIEESTTPAAKAAAKVKALK